MERKSIRNFSESNPVGGVRRPRMLFCAFGLAILGFALFWLFLNWNGNPSNIGNSRHVPGPNAPIRAMNVSWVQEHQPETDLPNAIRSNISQLLTQLFSAQNGQQRSFVHKLTITALFRLWLLALLACMGVRSYVRIAETGTFCFQTLLKNALPVRAGPHC